jgi:hypothetical protein
MRYPFSPVIIATARSTAPEVIRQRAPNAANGAHRRDRLNNERINAG